MERLFVTADVEIRAKRRCSQQHDADYQIILNDLKIRDERDQNRAIAPLKPAKDAIIIDSSNLTAQATLDELLIIISKFLDSYVCLS